MSESAMTAADEAYGGGIGGKFRRRPLRRAAATPYDRPPAAARGIRTTAAEAAGGRNRWLSKLVDPASRLITRGATRFFSTVFQKRLAAPPPAETPVAIHETQEDVSHPTNTDPSSETREQGNKNSGVSRSNPKDDGVSELEHLLKHKTFTRSEFDHLTDLLRSRIVDLPDDTPRKSESQALLLGDDHNKEEGVLGQQNETESLRTPRIISSPFANLKVPGEELASPAEVAKAYMGSRSTKLPFSSSLGNQTIIEASASPSFIGIAPKPSVAPVSSNSLSGLPGLPSYTENGLTTSRSRGRSALYKMSRSPYFKGPPTSMLKDNKISEDGYFVPSSSNQIPKNLTLSDGKQVLKRRSVLESDIGSVGPIRRIRQKSNLMSSSRDKALTFSENFLPASSDTGRAPIFSTPLPLPSYESKYDTPHQKRVEHGSERSSYSSVPLQSSEMARKILQQLDKLAPSSPKEKMSEVKIATCHEPPPKLGLHMLHGKALKSVAEIDSSKAFNVEINSKLNSHEYLRPSSSVRPSQDKVDQNGPSKPSVPADETAYEAKITETVQNSCKGTSSTKGPMAAIFQHSAAVPLQKKSAFTMQAPEDLVEIEEVSNNDKDPFGSPASVKENIETSAIESKIFVSKTQVTEKAVPLAESKLAHNIVLSKGSTEDYTDRTAADRDTGFTFQSLSTPLQLPLAPTKPSAFAEQSATLSGEVSAPVFKFSSKTSPLTFSPNMISFSESSSLKFGENSDTKEQLFGSSMGTSTTPLELESCKTDAAGKDGNLSKAIGTKKDDFFKSMGTRFSSTLMTSTVSNISCATSNTSGQSNGVLASAASIFSTSSAHSAHLSTPAVTFTSASSASGKASSNASAFSSTSIGMTLLQFGSAVADSSTPISAAVKSGSKDLGSEPVKGTSFGITSTTAPESSSGTTDIFGFGASETSGGGGSPGLVFGSQLTNSRSETSPFSQSTACQIGASSSPAFGLGSSTLGFGSSASGLSTGLRPFFSSSGFGQSSTASCLQATGSSGSSVSFASSVASPILFGSSSQSTTPVFGSVFGLSSSASTMFTNATSSTALSTSLFGSSSTSPPTFTSSSAATSSPFIFSQTGAASSSALPFTSFGTTSTSPSSTVPAFGISASNVGFGSSSPGNDQMNVEDSMADDAGPTTAPSLPVFGQPSSVPSPNIPFSSPATLSGASPFQFTSPQPSAFSQPPFQAAGSFELGGGFSMGSGGGEKSNRRFIKAKRDKHRKK